MIDCYTLTSEDACKTLQSCDWRTSAMMGPYCEFYHEPQCGQRGNVPGLDTDVKKKQFCEETEKCEWTSWNSCGYKFETNCFGKYASKEICEGNGECIFSVDDQSMCQPKGSDEFCRSGYKTPETCMTNSKCKWLTGDNGCYSYCYQTSNSDCTGVKNSDCYWHEALLNRCKSIENACCRVRANKAACEKAHCIGLSDMMSSTYLCSVYLDYMLAMQ